MLDTILNWAQNGLGQAQLQEFKALLFIAVLDIAWPVLCCAGKGHKKGATSRDIRISPPADLSPKFFNPLIVTWST